MLLKLSENNYKIKTFITASKKLDVSIKWILLIFWIIFINVRNKGNIIPSAEIATEIFREMPEACNFIKMRLWHRCFPVNSAKFLRPPFLTEHLRWLLLEMIKKLEEILSLILSNSLKTFIDN